MKKTFFLFSFLLYLGAVSSTAQYTVINNFNNRGLDPYAASPGRSLTLSVMGDTLYGTTYHGGKYAWGSIFYMTTDGSVYDTLISFTIMNSNGEGPQGLLVLSGNVLYGVTSYGGQYGGGVIFSIHTDGSQYHILFNFGEHLSWGYWGQTPVGGLMLSNGVLFGMTSAGGKDSAGNIFRINTDGTHFDTLHSFGLGSDGTKPLGALTLSGNVLYGMTQYGGKYNGGNIFSIDTDATGYEVLHNFGSGMDGENSQGSLTLSGNVLYGTTYFGGKYGFGNVFSIHTDGTIYDTLHNFNYSTGTDPAGSLVIVGNVLYGMTHLGGQFIYGNIFSIHTDGTLYDTLHNFGNGTDGKSPLGDLTLSKDIFFGTTYIGGIAGNGTVFKYIDKNVGTGISTASATAVDINIYPNPNNGSFTVVLPGSTNKSRIEVFNMLGEQIFSCTVISGNNIVNINSQPNGIYLYRITTPDGSLTGEGKLVIER